MAASGGVTPSDCRYLSIEKIENATIVYKMHFNSVGEVQLFLRDDPPRNVAIFPEYKSETADPTFAGPKLEQAIAYCIGGYEERYDQFLEFAHQLETINTRFATGRQVEKSFVGQRPNVPAYVAGAPKTMYRTKRAVEKKVINIYMNVTYPAGASEEQIQYRGIITLNLIRILERNDYIVNFRLFEISMIRGEIFVCEVVLKKPGDKLDSRMCYYPMCGKGFVRRIMARIKESMPFKGNWGFSYGSVVTEDKAKAIMNISNDDIYIGAPKDMNIKGRNLYEDTDAFLSKLGIEDKIVIPKYRAEKESMLF